MNPPHRTEVLERSISTFIEQRDQNQNPKASEIITMVLRELTRDPDYDPLGYPHFFELIGSVVEEARKEKQSRFPKKGVEMPGDVLEATREDNQ